MSVYIFAQIKEYALAGSDYGQTYQQQALGGLSQPVRYVCADLPEQKDIELYRKVGIPAEQVLSIHRYFTDHYKMVLSVRAEDKLKELKKSLHYTGVDERGDEIRLIRDGYVIATIVLKDENREYCRGIYYFSYARLIRAEIYWDGIAYVEYFKTAKSEDRLYAKLARRSFYNQNSSVAYDQIFEGEKEWYLFPDGRRYTRPQFMAEFVRRLGWSTEDTVILDEAVPDELVQAVFTYGKAARIVAAVHACYSFTKESGHGELFFHRYPYCWFRYAESLDGMVVSTEQQRELMIKELEAYHCKVPAIQVASSIEGEFTYAVLHESYGGGMALSWSYKGRPDGFWICDELGKQICETRNVHQHYFRIEGYGAEHGFAVKAFADTVKGKMAIAETGLVYLQTRHYGIPKVSLVIPVYNAEDYISRTMDNALAQSLGELEILAVDDGCTDSSPKILDWYAGKYPNVVVIHKENGGVTTARNTGMEAARGEYIGFMDNDDMIHPEMMESLYGSAEKNGCDVAVTSVYMVNSNGYIDSVQCALQEDIAISAKKFFKTYYIDGSELGVVVWNKIYRAALIKGFQFPILPYDDVAWTPCVLLNAKKICYLDGKFYEWDRTIRSSTLLSEWNKYKKEEMYEFRKNAVLYYLNHGNKEEMALLKESAKVYLKRWESVSLYEEYGKLWQEIEEKW